LARAIGLTPAGATDVIDRLERRGSVRRVRSSLDRRVVFVQLTPRGTDLYRSAQSTVRAALRALDADLAPAERRALTRGLAALLRTLGRSRTPEG
jgi:DNA-binding MarR family transcriptional regulator